MENQKTKTSRKNFIINHRNGRQIVPEAIDELTKNLLEPNADNDVSSDHLPPHVD